MQSKTSRWLALVTILLQSLLGACGSFAQPVAPTRPARVGKPCDSGTQGLRLTEREAADRAALQEELQDDIPYLLNPANDLHYRFLLHRLERSAITRETSPEFFRRLDAARARGKEEQGPEVDPAYRNAGSGELTSLNYLDMFTREDDETTTRYYARTLSAVPGGTYRTMISMSMVLDDESYVACVESDDFTEGEGIYAELSGSLPSDVEATTLVADAVIYVSPRNSTLDAYASNEEVRIYYMFRNAPSGQATGCQQEPNYHGHHDNCAKSGREIVACYERNDPTCDYCYCKDASANCDGQPDQDCHGGYPPTFELNVVGSATFPGELACIRDNVNNCTPADLAICNYNASGRAVIYLHNKDFTEDNDGAGGGCYLQAGSCKKDVCPEDLASYELEKDGGKCSKLTWNFQSKDFENKGCVNDARHTVDYYMSVQADVKAVGKRGVIFTSTQQGNVPNFTVIDVPKIAIRQGCLVPGTEILLADGSLKAIETFRGNGTEWVVANQHGELRQVVATTWGREDSILAVRYRAETGSEVPEERELLLTDEHPVVKASGVIVQAKDLQQEDVLRTPEGIAIVLAVERRAYDGPVWNLQLGNSEEARQGKTTMFANGLMVGDSEMQNLTVETRSNLKSREEVLSELPPEWHQDYLHWLERQRAAGQAKE